MIAAALAKAERRLAAVHRDLARISAAPRLLYETELLKTSKARPFDREAVVIDYASDPPSELRIALEPGKALALQIDKRFKLARRLMHAEDAALARLATVEQEIANLRAMLEAPESADLSALASRAKASRPKPAEEEARPYRVYASASGRPIWVGRSGSHNDRMTFKHAGPHDQWLHASGYAGAHVVVKKRRDEVLDQATLEDACVLAAHFSKAPEGTDVEVAITEVKFVRKFRGAATGQVQLSRERHRRVVNDPRAAKLIIARHAPARV